MVNDSKISLKGGGPSSIIDGTILDPTTRSNNEVKIMPNTFDKRWSLLLGLLLVFMFTDLSFLFIYEFIYQFIKFFAGTWLRSIEIGNTPFFVNQNEFGISPGNSGKF